MRAFTSRAASFFTRRSASALVLYAASWMVHVPRGALFVGAPTLSMGCTVSAGALVFFVVSVRDTETVESGSSTCVDGADVFEAFVVPEVLEVLVVPAGALPVVRGVGLAVVGCGGTPRDAPAGVTFVVDEVAVAVDGAAVVAAQCEP